MRKIIYLSFFISIGIIGYSQQSFTPSKFKPPHCKYKIEKVPTLEELQPVYFNYSRRKLFYNNIPIHGDEFLALCRTINDSAIAEQIAVYDHLTRNKKLILGGLVVSVSTYLGCMAGLTSLKINNNNAPVVLGSVAGAAVVSGFVCAFASSISHHKRKKILFYSLPIAYNNYLLNHQITN